MKILCLDASVYLCEDLYGLIKGFAQELGLVIVNPFSTDKIFLEPYSVAHRKILEDTQPHKEDWGTSFVENELGARIPILPESYDSYGCKIKVCAAYAVQLQCYLLKESRRNSEIIAQIPEEDLAKFLNLDLTEAFPQIAEDDKPFIITKDMLA